MLLVKSFNDPCDSFIITDAILGRFFKGKLMSGVMVKLVKGINQQ